MSEFYLSQVQLDTLKEISSISAGNTATSLANLFGVRVEITTPEILVEAIENVPEVLGGRDTVAHVLYFSISGQISGVIILIFSEKEALKMVNTLTKKHNTEFDHWGEMEISSLKEFGNIVVGTYLRFLQQNLDITSTVSVPGYTQDMLGAVLDGVLARFSLKTDFVIILGNNYLLDNEISNLQFVFLLEPTELKTILKAIG